MSRVAFLLLILDWFIAGIGDGNVERCEAILERCLLEYPKVCRIVALFLKPGQVKGMLTDTVMK